MQALAWIAVLGLLTLYFGGVLDRQRNPNTRIDTAVGAGGVREVRSYQTRLNEVGIGDIRLHGVDAAIAPGLQMREVLLGMSFLKHIEFTQRGNILTLRQYPP